MPVLAFYGWSRLSGSLSGFPRRFSPATQKDSVCVFLHWEEEPVAITQVLANVPRLWPARKERMSGWLLPTRKENMSRVTVAPASKGRRKDGLVE